MQEISLEKAKEIIIEPVPLPDAENTWCMVQRWRGPGWTSNMIKFTRLLMAAEVYHIDDIVHVQKNSRDLVHLAGIHKLPSEGKTQKASELRWFWAQLWEEDKAIKQIKGLNQYIADVCETSGYNAGKARRPYGLYLTNSTNRYPWRTPEWYEARRPAKIPFQKLTEFYPYISVAPTEDHDLLLAVDRLVPKGLNPDTRADVCQDMLVAVLSGDVSLENLAGERPKYMKQFFKMFPAKYGHLSLDAPLVYGGEDMKKTLGETIAAEYRN